jgi:predicted HAD superfamily Cof-like phosphohydrolase
MRGCYGIVVTLKVILMTQLSLFEYWSDEDTDEEPEYIPTREDFVKEFHEAFGLPTGEIDPTTLYELVELRKNLMREELDEVFNALDVWMYYVQDGVDADHPKAELLKELCDLNYVLSGTAVVLGLDLEEAFCRVHDSNMSKLGPDGKPIYRDDGKVLKGQNYKPPYLEDLV